MYIKIHPGIRDTFKNYSRWKGIIPSDGIIQLSFNDVFIIIKNLMEAYRKTKDKDIQKTIDWLRYRC